MKKRVLVSLLEENEGLGRLLCQEIAKCGLEPQAHYWDADPEKMAWGAVARELATCSAWVIAGADFSGREVRTSLSLAALAVQAEKGNAFPILLSAACKPPDSASLPTPLAGAEIVKSGIGAKVAVQANTAKKLRAAYRLRPHALGKVGLWFEVGPADEPWAGAFFASGTADASDRAAPNAHGVGIPGTVPARCTLQYPVEGIRLDIRGIPCTGWGVKNDLTASNAYYVRLGACPDVIAFGAFPDTDDAELFTVRLV